MKEVPGDVETVAGMDGFGDAAVNLKLGVVQELECASLFENVLHRGG